MKKREITVTISGLTGVGKTTLMALIEKTLMDLDISTTAEWTDGQPQIQLPSVRAYEVRNGLHITLKEERIMRSP